MKRVIKIHTKWETQEETEDPEFAFETAMHTYLKKGYSKEWVNQRLKSIDIRKELTDEWQTRGMKEGLEYAILTDEITKRLCLAIVNPAG